MGKSGVSILFLSKPEDSYVEYLNLKKVPITEMPAVRVEGINDIVEDEQMEEEGTEKELNYEEGITVENALPKVLDMVLHDHDLVEKSSAAFMSYVRSYKEHQLNYIFKFSNIRWKRLVRAFCLVQLPKLRELKKSKVKLDPELAEVDIDTIPYKDSQREKARLERLKKQAEEKREEVEKKEKEKSLSQKKQEIRKTNDIRTKNKKRIYEFLEYEETRKEKNLLKMLRNGKISEEEYADLSGEAAFEQSLLNGNADVASTGGKKKKQKLGTFESSLAAKQQAEEEKEEPVIEKKKQGQRHRKKKGKR
jgi:ATP-dependent RNA helicase DDX55/SPB4